MHDVILHMYFFIDPIYLLKVLHVYFREKNFPAPVIIFIVFVVVILLGIGLMFGTKSNNDNDDSTRKNQIHPSNTFTEGANTTETSISIFTNTVTPTIHSNVTTAPNSAVNATVS